MNNVKLEYKGDIVLGTEVIVSDPCYGLGTWCQGVVKNVAPGTYQCNVEYYEDVLWGTRVSAIEVIRDNYYYSELDYKEENFEVGVDSGQAGIFDYNYYKLYHKECNNIDHVNDNWYDRICNFTHERIKNPDFEEFNWDTPEESVEERYMRCQEYDKSDKRFQYINRLTGNVIDCCGLVASSGYGDGSYYCYTADDQYGNVIAIRVEFINEDDEDDYDEEDEYYDD